MKRRCRRNMFKRVAACLLASVVLLTSFEGFQVRAVDKVSNTQTGYKSLIEFQVDRWNTILKEVFENTVEPTTVNGNTASATIPSITDMENKRKAVVQEGNLYFNWETEKTAGLEEWSGGKGELTLENISAREETIVYDEDSVEGVNETKNAPETKVKYTVYDVKTADELYCVMNAVRDVDYNVKINLCADIDLNGVNKIWYSKDVQPVCLNKNHWYYIEGNGYTIYNMKTRSTGTSDYNIADSGTASFLGYLAGDNVNSKKVVLKNTNFSNCLVISGRSLSAVVVGMNTGRLYMENVNVEDSFLYSNAGNVAGILGRNQCKTGAMFMRNCSTSGLYAFGTDHVGGFSGTFYNTEGIKHPVRYDTDFPKFPESWMAKAENIMPLMVENCYSVDSELFSVGTSGDSGAFISCGGKFICRNSFTNNIIYGSTNTGAFIGRLVTVEAGKYGMQDDKGSCTVATYFENCYASGSVEGRDKIGGFAGYDCGSWNDSDNNRGITVYKNCYTTAMAGMDYAGRQVGGFIGHENTHENQKASIAVGTNENKETIYTDNPGSVYINCYAAGEVGNILTEADADYECKDDESDAQGGFLGAVGFWGFGYHPNAMDEYSSAHGGESNGNYINCYYDMQTTGMRERASGKKKSFNGDSQIPGVTGVYTQYSEAKKVQGLAYSDTGGSMNVSMGDNNVWMYRNEYYPALTCFYGAEEGGNARKNFGKLNESGKIETTAEVTYLDEEMSAVLLDALKAGTLTGLVIDSLTGEVMLDSNADGDLNIMELIEGIDGTVLDGIEGEQTGTVDGAGTVDGTEMPGTTDGTGSVDGTGTPGTTDGAGSVDGTETPGATDGAGSVDGTETPGATDGTEPGDNTGAAGSPEGTEAGDNTGVAGNTEGTETGDSTEAGTGDNTGAAGSVDSTEDAENAGDTESVESIENDEDAGSVQSVESSDDTVVTGSIGHTRKAASAVRAAKAASTVSAVRVAKTVSMASPARAVSTSKAARVVSVASTVDSVGAGDTNDNAGGGSAGGTGDESNDGTSGNTGDDVNGGTAGNTGDDVNGGTSGNTGDDVSGGTSGNTGDDVSGGTSGNTGDDVNGGTAGNTGDDVNGGASGNTGDDVNGGASGNTGDDVNGGTSGDTGDVANGGTAGTTGDSVNGGTAGITDGAGIIDGTDPVNGMEITDDAILLVNGEPLDEGIRLFVVGEGEPVSQNYDEDTQERIQKKLDEKAAMVPNYLQASVSTVFLDHWDSAMNMDTGSLGGETDWAVGLSANELTKKDYKENDPQRWSQDTDGKYWEIAYKNLAAGTYELKIQAGESWTYNFGSDKFGQDELDGEKCRLEVPADCDVKIKFDYAAPASITGENTNFRIWAEFYKDLYDEEGNENPDAELLEGGVQELGSNAKAANASTWTVVGNFPDSNWDKENTAFDMRYLGTGHRNGDYELVMTLPKGDYSFQITRNHSWDECYGRSGNNGRDENMTFTLKRECEVSILFNENTHLTSVVTNPEDALEKSQTMETKVEFEGYSVISSKAITGHNWLDSVEAAKAGEMMDEDDNDIYEASFTVKGKENFYKNHGYKVITNGQDAGNPIYFYLSGPGADRPDGEYEVKLTFSYNSQTGETWVKDEHTGNESWVNNNPDVKTWNVLGSKELTGHSWDEGMTETEKQDMSRGKMELADSTEDTEKTDYFINYPGVPAGTHSFKVVANGSFEDGIEYGSYDGNNYLFTTSRESTITIHFNSKTKEITVEAVPAGSIVESEYVVVGNESLTDANWDASSDANRMGYQGGYQDTYTKDYTVKSGDRCTFKVVHFGTDDSTEPISVDVVGGEKDKEYRLEVVYHARNATTEYHLYDEVNHNVTSYLEPAKYSSWSVLGDKGLTGYNWAQDDPDRAAGAGKMEHKGDDVYTITFQNVEVSASPTLLNFKVVAEGNWDTGVSYGGRLGNNYAFVLQSDKVKACSVTITFDAKTHEINVSTNPGDCVQTGSTINESGLTWYVAGDYDLVSEDAYYTAPTVYDTVRDITAAFTFTSGSHVAWDYDMARNDASGFFSRIGTNKKGTGFSLKYQVEDKDPITGIFNEKVITLENAADGDHTSYYCERFMPGKQWVKVMTGVAERTGGDEAESAAAGKPGSRSIRLIPTAYLEAGNDANIYVLQSESDTALADVQNTVVYQKNALEDISFIGLDDNVKFNRYNVALTAAYAISDRVGFGYYGNYSQQKVVTYPTNETPDGEKIRPNELDPSQSQTQSQTYFAMSSVFTKAAFYDDGNIPEGETSNLVIDELVDQNLIGSSYGEESDTTKAKTIIKVAKVDKESGSTTKVFTTRNTKSDNPEDDQNKTAYEKNYLKWTGQMPFDSDDAGTYEVTYYWSLSDGRYLSDSKKVTIYSGLATIKKAVDTNYFEIEDTKGTDENGEDKSVTLKYTVNYNNPVAGDFAIVDVLPFDRDIRKDGSREGGTNSSTIGRDTHLKLKSVTVQSGSGAAITNLQTYYTSNLDVQEYVKDNLRTDVAYEVLRKDDINWIEANEEVDADNATAIKVTGTQTEEGANEITLTYTIEVTDAQRGDHYVNNAFFTVTRADKTSHAEGVSNPVVTGAVGREFSGYVWIDSDLDGRYDDTEPAVDGVKVTLQQWDGKAWKDVDKKLSNAHEIADGQTEHGYYEFTDICPGGEYRVIFEAPDNGDKLTFYNADGTELTTKENVTFEKLNLTRRLYPYQVEEKRLSRNIADYLGDPEKEGYIKTYFINEELPGTEKIYNNNTQPNFQGGKVENYYFTRLYQNLGLTEVVDVKGRTNSLTIQKREGNLEGKPIPGVKFKLEYSLDAKEDAYETVHYYVEKTTTGKDEYVFVDPADVEKLEKEGKDVQKANAVATDEAGKFRFVNLPTADYRLTEVEPAEGYNPLGAPVEFTLPYVMRTEEGEASPKSQDGFVAGSRDDKNNYYDSELEPGVVYYYDITYTITNSKPPHMPLTGHWRELLPLLLAGILFTGAVGLYTVYRVKKRRIR